LLRWGVLLTLAALALVMGIFYSASHGTQTVNASVTFTPVSLEDPHDILQVRSSALPNEVVAIGNIQVAKDKWRWDVLRITVKDDSPRITLLFSNKDNESHFPILLTEDGDVLLHYYKKASGAKYGYLDRKAFSLFDPRDASETDVTPSNYREILKSFSRSDKTSDFYDHKQGMALLAWNSDEHSMTAWQSKAKLEKAGTCENVIAKVEMYVDGRFAYGALTENGDIVVYDSSTGLLKPVSGHETVAKAVAKVLGQDGERMPDCVFAKDIAAFKRSGSLTVFLADGKSWSRRFQSSIEYRPNGRKRPAKEADAISFLVADELVREEARHLPPDFISGPSQLIAFNDNSIALYDNFYQRLVIITPKG
jgi:hypothetical protein